MVSPLYGGAKRSGIADPQYSKTFYISPTGNDTTGDGSKYLPWATLAYACSQVQTPGHCIFVESGTYTETVQSDLAVGVSIRGTGDGSIITSAAALNPMIELWSDVEGTNGNQSISNIKLSGNNLTVTRAILVNLRSNVKIHDVTISDFSDIGIEFDGIAVLPSPVIYSTGNEIYNCLLHNTCGRGGAIRFCGQSGMIIHDNTINGYQRALGHDPTLVQMGGGYSKGLKFYNNTLNMDRLYFAANGTTALWGFHIESWDCQGGYEFYGNTFNGGHVPIDIGGTFNVKGAYDYSWYIHDNNWQWSAQWPTQVDGSFGLVCEGGVSDVIITKNKFKNTPWGISGSIVQSPRIHENIEISYNVFENTGWGDDVWGFGIWIGQGSVDAITRNWNIYNNTMISGTGAGGSMSAGIVISSSNVVSFINIRNNIIANAAAYAHIVFWDSAGAIEDITIQNNVLFNNGNANNILFRNGKVVTRLVNTGDIKLDPLVVSQTNFRLQATSPCLNAGLDLGFTEDFEGTKVPQGSAPDIGAFERV